jgi:dienelactone hydrolase
MNKVLLGIILAGATLGASAQRISIPKVYSQENTGNQLTTISHFPTAEELPVIEKLPDALSWYDGSGRVSKFNQWERRRNEIGSLIQHYGIGTKPAIEDGQVTARMKDDTLLVYVTVGGKTIRLSSEIHYPSVGKPPYAVMIGTSMIALPKTLFDDKPIATMVFHEKQVNDYGQWGPHHERGEHPFDHLYPKLTDNGAYSEWAWGMSRLIDALQQLGPEITKIDTKRIGVTGCSYAGKMALYCGAFDERIALTIAQEPGGGGAAAWRVSHTMEEVEDIDKTDYHWFMESQRENFGGDNVYKLPYDQHELCAMVCPRALLLLGNPDYKWLADESMRVSAEAAREVWRTFGIEDRFDCDIIGGHPHCQLPESQYPIVNKFLEYLINIKK